MTKQRRNFLAVCLMLVSICFGFSACTADQDEEAKNMNDRLAGFWEVVHYRDVDYWQTHYTDGSYGEKTGGTSDFDVEPTMEDYSVLYFNAVYSTVTMVATGDPDNVESLNVPSTYRIDGNKIQGLMFGGDYVNYCVIETLTDDRLVIALIDDNGTDPETGDRQWYSGWLTYRRVQY